MTCNIRVYISTFKVSHLQQLYTACLFQEGLYSIHSIYTVNSRILALGYKFLADVKPWAFIWGGGPIFKGGLLLIYFHIIHKYKITYTHKEIHTYMHIHK